MSSFDYPRDQIERVRKNGADPEIGNVFRLKITGADTETKWLNVTSEQVQAIAEILSDRQRGIVLWGDQLSEWAGRRLTIEEVGRLDDCIPNSSIPDAIGDIVASFDTGEQS